MLNNARARVNRKEMREILFIDCVISLRIDVN